MGLLERLESSILAGLEASRLAGWQAGWNWLARKFSQPNREAVGPTRKTRILDSCRSGGFQAGWLAGWLARKLAYLVYQLWAY